MLPGCVHLCKLAGTQPPTGTGCMCGTGCIEQSGCLMRLVPPCWYRPTPNSDKHRQAELGLELLVVKLRLRVRQHLDVCACCWHTSCVSSAWKTGTTAGGLDFFGLPPAAALVAGSLRLGGRLWPAGAGGSAGAASAAFLAAAGLGLALGRRSAESSSLL